MTSTHVISSNQINELPPSVEAFANRHGDEHLILACHAAVPLGLTPQLLYSLWAYFQTDIQGQSLNIPWTATADLLLSQLCDEVGPGIYEMNLEIRNILLNYLEYSNRFGIKRTKEVAAFLGAYAQSQLKSDILDVRDFFQAQNWVFVAYLFPERAAKELATTLAETFTQKSDDLYRIASIVGALERSLGDYPDLLAYAQGMAKYAQGDIESAQKRFIKIRNSWNLSGLLVKGVPFPQNSKYQEITGFSWPIFAHQTYSPVSQSIDLISIFLLIFLLLFLLILF